MFLGEKYMSKINIIKKKSKQSHLNQNIWKQYIYDALLDLVPLVHFEKCEKQS